MAKNNDFCEPYKELMVRLIDGEITPAEREKLEMHLQACPDCRADLAEMKRWKGVSGEMKNKLLPDMARDEYWRHIYNRLERGVAWILVSLGAIILLGFAVAQFLAGVLKSTQMSGLEKFGVLALALGFVVLFVSVVREKLMVGKHDKYKEIQR